MTTSKSQPFLCSECGVEKVWNGAGRVVHEDDCSIGKARERWRFDYWERVRKMDARVAEAKELRKDYEKEEASRWMAPKGHQFITMATGHHNPKNPNDWCYLIHCECGYKDLAWNYDDACELRSDHRAEYAADVPAPAPTAPPKPPRTLNRVANPGKPARRSTAQPTKPKRVIY